MMRWSLTPMVVLLVFTLSALTVRAQEEDQKPKPAVIKVTEAHRSKEKDGKNDTVELGDDLVIKVENLETLLEKARSTMPAKKILLFLDGRPLKDVAPFPPMDPSKSILSFPLRRTENSRDAWTAILGKPRWEREISVSIGLEDSYPIESEAKIKFRVIPEGWFFFWAVLFVLLLLGFWALAVKSDLLRDPVPTGAPGGGGGRRPYSLSRMQAAWWFFLVLASYLFIGMITGDFRTTITGTVLVLVGISAGTSVGSAVIDASKPPRTVAPTNVYWWQDILSDADGVSIHRFQIAVWTLVLGIIFAVQVYEVLAMPTFDASLLSLMGISSGTYLGLKIPEKT